MEGTIAAVTLARNFGFIVAIGEPRNIFFHASELREGLEWNEQLYRRRVCFDAREAPKGLVARNVRPAP